jgi:hypothetical protein
MPETTITNENGIIRWQHLTTTMTEIRREFREEIQKVEEGQARNTEEIAKLRAEVSSLKTEIRIWGAILMMNLVGLIGLIFNQVVP